MRQPTKNILLMPVPKTIIITLNESTKPMYISQISKEVDATFCHVYKVLIKFKNFRWITITKKGRRQLCEITEEGKRVAKAVEIIILSGEEFK